MIERTEERFNIKPERLAADTAYGSGPNLNWLVKGKDIAPHIPVIDKSKREDRAGRRQIDAIASHHIAAGDLRTIQPQSYWSAFEGKANVAEKNRSHRVRQHTRH